MKKYTFIMIGFLMGAIYVMGCGGGSSSIARTIVEAIDMVYDNSGSGLRATSVQEAIDELTVFNRDNLVGAWEGEYLSSTENSATTLTLNADDSFSCNNDAWKDSKFNEDLCARSTSWEVIGNAIRLSYISDDRGEDKEYSAYFPITSVTANKLVAIVGMDENGGMVVLSLNK